MPEQQIPLKLFRTQAPVSLWERNRKGHTFGELTPDQLVTILADAKDGKIEQWIELCSYALETDLHLQSLNYTRKSLVLGNGDYSVTPGKSTDPRAQAMAVKAATFCDVAWSNIPLLNTKLMTVLDAIGHGVSAHELEWGRRDGANVVKDLRWVHARRFRWDENWNLRLYDYGSKMGGDYGEELQKDCWLVLVCKDRGGYPGEAGILRSCIWPWLFKMWVNRYHIHATERYGQPFISATVPKGSESAVRTGVLSKLEQLSYDTVGVFEEGTEIIFQGGPSTVNNGEMFEKYLKRADEAQTKAILGATDIVDPGVHGSQSAVETRSEITVDPRTLVGREQLQDAIETHVFEPMIRYNLHLWDGVIPPTPKIAIGVKSKRDTVYDVVGQTNDIPAVDQSSIESTLTKQQVSLNGAQVTSLVEVLQNISAGVLPRDSGLALIKVAFSLDDKTASEIVGSIGLGGNAIVNPAEVNQTPDTVQPTQPATQPESAPMEAPKKKLSSKTSTQQTLRFSTNPLEIALSGELDD